jgi:tetratricopeptide (TPR) repeat protein
LNSLSQLAICKILTGSIEDAIPLEQQAIRLSPRDPFIRNFYLNLGLAHLLQSHADEAIVWFEKARGMASGWPYSFLAAIYGLRGEPDKAAANLAEARKLFPELFEHRPPESRGTLFITRILGGAKGRCLVRSYLFRRLAQSRHA